MRKSGDRFCTAAFVVMSASSAAAAQPAPVPPPLAQLGADCIRTQYASDMLVCGDAGLSALDAKVAGLAAAAGRTATDAVLEDQAAWMRRRSLCAFKADHRACLLAAYTDRLAALTAGPAVATQTWQCSGAWQGRRLTISAPVIGQPLTIREDSRLLAIATPKIAAWQPFLAWRATGNRIRLEAQDGRQFDCRPAPD